MTRWSELKKSNYLYSEDISGESSALGDSGWSSHDDDNGWISIKIYELFISGIFHLYFRPQLIASNWNHGKQNHSNEHEQRAKCYISSRGSWRQNPKTAAPLHSRSPPVSSGFLNGKVLTSLANQQHSETLLSNKERDGLWPPGFRRTTPPYFSSPEPQLSEATLC